MPLRNLRASEAVRALKGFAPDGAVLADDRQNAVVVTGNGELLATVRALLTSMDAPGRQVMVEVRVADVQPINDTTDVGFQFGGTGFGAGALAQFPYTLTKSSVAVNAQIDTLIQHGRASILAQPRIATLNNREASLLIGEQYPVVTVNQQTGFPSVQTIDVGVRLRLTPTIGDDGTITAELHPEYSQIIGFNDSFPIIANRKIDATLRVHDGETIVLGGLFGDIDSETVTKFPDPGRSSRAGRLLPQPPDDAQQRRGRLLPDAARSGRRGEQDVKARSASKAGEMKRRRGRRGPRRPLLPIVALLIAGGIVAGAVALIVRGDTTPRPVRVARHVAPTFAPAAPQATITAGVRTATAAPSPVAAVVRRGWPTPPTEATSTPAAPSGGPKLALIIDDCGQWPDTEHGFIALPVAAHAVRPSARALRNGDRARRAGGRQGHHAAPADGAACRGSIPGRAASPPRWTMPRSPRRSATTSPRFRSPPASTTTRAAARPPTTASCATWLRCSPPTTSSSSTRSPSARRSRERDAACRGDRRPRRRDVFLDNVADVDATEAQLRRRGPGGENQRQRDRDRPSATDDADRRARAAPSSSATASPSSTRATSCTDRTSVRQETRGC